MSTKSLLTDQQRQRLEAAARAAMLRVILDHQLPVRLGHPRTAYFGPGVEYIGAQIIPREHPGLEGQEDQARHSE